jgi:hypothetical protein
MQSSAALACRCRVSGILPDALLGVRFGSRCPALDQRRRPELVILCQLMMKVSDLRAGSLRLVR